MNYKSGEIYWDGDEDSFIILNVNTAKYITNVYDFEVDFINGSLVKPIELLTRIFWGEV